MGTHHHHAVVLGAGIAGLLTAQALSRHFAYVTIVERDHLPAEPRGRPGQPPGESLQLLFPRGRAAIEHLLPGFSAELVSLGAVEIDLAGEVRWLSASGWLADLAGNRRVISSTSRLVEWHLRRRVQESSGIAVLDGRAAKALLPGWDGKRVSGVRLRDPDGEFGAPSALRADLVVDAMGRRSPLPVWLEGVGFERPSELSSEPSLSFAARVYRIADRSSRWRGAYIEEHPSDTGRTGAAFEVEGGRLLVALQGVGGDHPPGDDAGFRAFARSLRSQAVFEAIRDATALSPIATYLGAGGRRRHIERASRWPERLLVVGDSAWTFNPIADQGVAAAALAAGRLDEQLRRRGDRSLDGLASTFRGDVANACREAARELPGRRLRTAVLATTGDAARAAHPSSAGPPVAHSRTRVGQAARS